MKCQPSLLKISLKKRLKAIKIDQRKIKIQKNINTQGVGVGINSFPLLVSHITKEPSLLKAKISWLSVKTWGPAKNKFSDLWTYSVKRLLWFPQTINHCESTTKILATNKFISSLKIYNFLLKSSLTFWCHSFYEWSLHLLFRCLTISWWAKSPLISLP